MTDLVLHHGVPSRSATVRWMLEEVGQPYRVEVLHLRSGEQHRPAYLALNPMGKVPTLVHDGVAVSETAAICAYLADAFPEARLNVSVGDRARGPYLKWMFFGPSCLEPAIADRAFPRAAEAVPGSLGWRDFETVVQVLADAVRDRPFLVADRFTAADVVIGSGLRWGMMFKMIPERDEFLTYVAGLNQRPAFQRATALDQELSAAAA